MSNVWGLWVFLWLSTRLMCQSLEFFETNLFHTNKNVEWILKSVAKQSTLLQVSVYEYYIPIIAGCILPLYFACLWAKLMRVNRPHCSQVGNWSWYLTGACRQQGWHGVHISSLLFPSAWCTHSALFGTLAALWYLPAPWSGDLCLDWCPPALATFPAGEGVWWGSEKRWFAWGS